MPVFSSNLLLLLFRNVSNTGCSRKTRVSPYDQTAFDDTERRSEKFFVFKA